MREVGGAKAERKQAKISSSPLYFNPFFTRFGFDVCGVLGGIRSVRVQIRGPNIPIRCELNRPF